MFSLQRKGEMHAISEKLTSTTFLEAYFSKDLKKHIPFDPIITLLAIYPK